MRGERAWEHQRKWCNDRRGTEATEGEGRGEDGQWWTVLQGRGAAIPGEGEVQDLGAYLKTNEETGGLLETLQAEHQSALRPACDVSGGEVEEARMPVPLIPTHMAPLAAQAPASGELAPLMALGYCGCRERHWEEHKQRGAGQGVWRGPAK